MRGEKHEAYAITEEFAGSDVSALETTARREGDEYVINGVKWHVTSFNLADYVFVQAVLTDGPHAGDHVLLVVDLPWPGVEVVRTPHYSHNIADEHPIVSFTDVRVPVSHLVGAEGEGMTFTQDWFRFERIMVASRCVGAAQRLVDEMTAFAKDRASSTASRSASTSWWRACSPTAPPNCSPRAAMLYEVARGIDAGLDRKALHGQASMAKLYCSEMAGPGRRPGGADLRRPRLHARERRRADVPRAARRADLGGRQRDSADHHRTPADAARPAAVLEPR